MKILVIAFRALGDMVLITPVLHLLKTERPQTELTVVVDAISYEVLLNHPSIDRLIVVDRNENKKLPLTQRFRKEWGLISQLRSERFDAAVDLFGGPRSAIMTWLSGAPIRCGEKERGRLRSIFYTHPARVEREGEHLVRQKLKIVQSLISPASPSADRLSLELFVTDEERREGRECFRRVGISEEGVVVGLFPGAGWEHKRWPPEKFAALADRLVDSLGVHLVLIGGVRDRSACEEVSSRMSSPAVALIQRSVRETMAIIERLDLFISNDTGPMHIATALGCPTIALFGPSNKIKYGPWGGQARIVSEDLPCSPCPQQVDTCEQVGRERRECMKRIGVERVYQEAVALIGRARGQRIKLNQI